MIFRKMKEYLAKKKEEADFIVSYETKKIEYEALKKDLDLLLLKVTEDTARLKITEERILETQKEAELKLKLAETSGNPETIFKECLKLAFGICWDLNKENTKEIIGRIREEISEKERIRYDKAISAFLKKFDYIEGILTPESIAKVLYKLKDDKIIAERIENKIALNSINNQLNVLKELGIAK